MGDIFMYELVIIGSGCAGLSAIIYAKRAMLNAVIIEKNYNGAGQITESEQVDNYPGLYAESGFDLGNKFREHAKKVGAEFINAEVIDITNDNNIYNIKCSDNSVISARTVIYAAGCKHRKLNIIGEKELIGKGVSYCAICDGAFYKDKTVAVIGGGDTALSEAVLLSKTANKVYLIHRRDKFRANKVLQEKVRSTDNIEIILSAIPMQIIGAKNVESIDLIINNERKRLCIDGVFIAVGYVPNSNIVKDMVDLDNNGYIIADESGKTSKNGFFVAGDVRQKQLRQIVTAVSDGANCVASVERYLENLI